MKQTVFAALVAAVLFASCSRQTCYPTKGSRDYAWKVIKEPVFTGPGHVVLVQRFSRGVRERREVFYECLPDSVRLGSFVNL